MAWFIQLLQMTTMCFILREINCSCGDGSVNLLIVLLTVDWLIWRSDRILINGAVRCVVFLTESSLSALFMLLSRVPFDLEACV